jgi:hypothetical protein
LTKRCFVFVAADGYRIDESRKSAWSISNYRVSKGYWPLYLKTRNIKVIGPGDKFLLYLAGTKCFSQSIIGAGVIGSDLSIKSVPLEEETIGILSPQPERLVSVRHFVKTDPIDIKSIIHLFSAYQRMDNKARWGALFMGGCMSISSQEYNKIVGEISSI